MLPFHTLAFVHKGDRHARDSWRCYGTVYTASWSIHYRLMEETGRTVCDVTNTGPWECTMDLARQVWDTSRHVEIFLKLLERVEGYSGELWRLP